MKRLFISFEHSLGGSAHPASDEQRASRAIFEQILACLGKKGGGAMSDPAPWESYGWYLEARSGNATITCMIQRSDAWLLQIFPKRSLVDRMTGVHHERELRAFAHAVAESVHEAFGVPVPAVQSEAEFLR